MRHGERAQVAPLFSVIRLLPVTDAIARRVAEHLHRYRRSLTAIDVVDCVVAATAELHEAQLATLNARHFPMFNGRRSRW
jgi:hypothetical protein